MGKMAAGFSFAAVQWRVRVTISCTQSSEWLQACLHRRATVQACERACVRANVRAWVLAEAFFTNSV
jgi:hypothetical protein